MKNKIKIFRIAIFVYGPANYQVPLWKKISKIEKINLYVYFERGKYVNKLTYNKEFNTKIKWDSSLLERYNYKFLNNKFSVFSKIYKRNFDSVIIHGWNSFTNWLAILTCFITRTSFLIHGENPLNQEKKKKGIKQLFKRFILKKFLFRYASAFLYIGEQNKKFYKHYGVPEKKLFFVPYAVDNNRFQKAAEKLRPQRDNFRKELGISKKDVVILFVGKLIYKKRPFDLLKAYEKVLQRKPSYKSKLHLVFVGDGSLRNDLKAYTDKNKLENVRFVGFENQTELPQYYSLSDVFILPSGMGETWGLVVNEAMNFKLPIIISDMPGSGYDLVKEGENGYKFPVGDINSLSKKIFKLVNNKEKREKFGKKSFEIIKDHNYKKDIKGILKALEYYN